jgi:hypothetical protein
MPLAARSLALYLGVLLAGPAAAKAPRRSVEDRLADLSRALRCADPGAPDDAERRAACLVAMHWREATADPLPNGDTPLVGSTVEFPDVRGAAWRPIAIPAVGGMRVDKTGGRVCEMDMYAETTEQHEAITVVRAPLATAFASLTGPLVVPPAVAAEARERVAHAPSVLRRSGGSWVTRFQGDVSLRHLGRRWFLVETRRGDSGLWVSVFTDDFTVAP